MDQKCIGAFIAQCRKEKKLTQAQLAELLNVTNQAISKWENGRGMPDVSLLEPLCNILNISLNELFSGEHIPIEKYKEKAEENISKLYKEKQITSLKPAKYLLSVLINITFFVTIVELIVGLIGNFFNEKILEVMLWNASVWLFLFVISISKLAYNKKKLKTLKDSGICIEAKIKKVIPASWIRIGNYNTLKVVCEYIHEGKEYTAISNYYVVTPFLKIENLYANVYTEKNNLAKYSVEILQTEL